jgi:hypothetical protein
MPLGMESSTDPRLLRVAGTVQRMDPRPGPGPGIRVLSANDRSSFGCGPISEFRSKLGGSARIPSEHEHLRPRWRVHHYWDRNIIRQLPVLRKAGA